MQNLQFKNDFIPEINQKSYQSKGLCKGVIVKITKTSIYFDIGLKFLVKTSKRKFLKNFYKIEDIIEKKLYNTEFSKKSFLNSVKVGNTYKFIIYQTKLIETEFFINFEKTLEYYNKLLSFYEFNLLQRNNKDLFGYVLNSVNGGFSIALNGLIAFVPNNKLFPTTLQNFSENRLQNKRKTRVLNTTLKFNVLSINFDRNNVVVQRKN